jgi:hypothetical protein
MKILSELLSIVKISNTLAVRAYGNFFVLVYYSILLLIIPHIYPAVSRLWTIALPYYVIFSSISLHTHILGRNKDEMISLWSLPISPIKVIIARNISNLFVINVHFAIMFLICFFAFNNPSDNLSITLITFYLNLLFVTAIGNIAGLQTLVRVRDQKPAYLLIFTINIAFLSLSAHSTYFCFTSMHNNTIAKLLILLGGIVFYLISLVLVSSTLAEKIKI